MNTRPLSGITERGPRRIAFLWALLFLEAVPANAQSCTHPQDISFYADAGYKVRAIEFRHPFGFLFFVRRRLGQLEDELCAREGDPSLCVKEGSGFSAKGYTAAFNTVKSSVQADRSFGSTLVTIVAVTASIQNCQENDTPKTVDIVYRILSTDPFPSIRATPEDRHEMVEHPATTTAEKNTSGKFKFQPAMGYDRTRRGYGGGAMEIRLPGGVADTFRLSGAGSTSTAMVDAQIQGEVLANRSLLDRADYSLGYRHMDSPASGLRLARGDLHAVLTGSTKRRETPLTLSLLRYGASVEQGNQQSNLSRSGVPADVLTNSAYGMVRLYGGGSVTSRYSETAISYALGIGGPGLASLNFLKHVGDVRYGRRFPGGSHREWDVEGRLRAGGITGSDGILINERFFGGNAAAENTPGSAWQIADGPLVRSIPARRLTGTGFGGTSFFSANFTMGKVIYHSPIIPADIENSPGFGESIEAAEATAQTFFADDYTYNSPQFTVTTMKFSKLLTEQLAAAKAVLDDARANGPASPSLNTVLKDAASNARGARQIAVNAAVPGPGGRLDGIKLKQLVNSNPKANRLLALLENLRQLSTLVSAAAKPKVEASLHDLQSTMTELGRAFTAAETGPERQKDLDRAKADMARPREVIDTLRHEANRFSFSLVALVDAGRIWPDPDGTRYAIGGGGHLSLVNVNLNLGYAFNPHPISSLGQGRGAVFISLTYTNLFR